MAQVPTIPTWLIFPCILTRVFSAYNIPYKIYPRGKLGVVLGKGSKERSEASLKNLETPKEKKKKKMSSVEGSSAGVESQKAEEEGDEEEEEEEEAAPPTSVDPKMKKQVAASLRLLKHLFLHWAVPFPEGLGPEEIDSLFSSPPSPAHPPPPPPPPASGDTHAEHTQGAEDQAEPHNATERLVDDLLHLDEELNDRPDTPTDTGFQKVLYTSYQDQQIPQEQQQQQVLTPDITRTLEESIEAEAGTALSQPSQPHLAASSSSAAQPTDSPTSSGAAALFASAVFQTDPAGVLLTPDPKHPPSPSHQA